MSTAPAAIVMNMFYTGLGIARSLGSRGVRVIGLTAQHRLYGNFTRYARCLVAPDSKNEPEELLTFLLDLGHKLGHRAIIFPTRDHDVVFLDRFRGELEPYFVLTIPNSDALQACLDKWQTWQFAQRAGVASPRCWHIESRADLTASLPDVTYPCVLKPVEAHHWRRSANWAIVGGRKAISIASENDLLAEYDGISQAEGSALIQELVPGGDNCLLIQACYLDRNSTYIAGFNTQKLVQIPEGFGTGCIVQTTNCPELREPTGRLLRTMGYTGIAEVEYKWNAAQGEYQLIEVNPRPWDQHRLGHEAGADVIYFAYCEHAGLPVPALGKLTPEVKWIAEDAFLIAVLRLLWRGDGNGLKELFRNARGRRIYAIWWARDPIPFLGYLTGCLVPELAASLRVLLRRVFSVSTDKKQKKAEIYERQLEKGNS